MIGQIMKQKKNTNYKIYNLQKWLDKIQLNPNLSIQEDFNEQHTDGIIYANQNFKYQINDSVFINKSNQKTIYSVYIQISDQYVELPKNHWIVFNPQTNIISGTPSLSIAGDVLCLMINATDTYSIAEGYIYFEVQKGAATIFLQIFLGILIPIIIILIIHHFKSMFYNIFFTKYFVHSTEVIEIGKEYTKQIILSDEIFRVAEIIWESYKKIIDQKAILKEIALIKSKKDEVNVSNSVSMINKFGIITLQQNGAQEINKNFEQESNNVFQNADAGIEMNYLDNEQVVQKVQKNKMNGTHNALDSNSQYFYDNGEIKKSHILKSMAIFFQQFNQNCPQLQINQRVTSEDILDVSSKISKILIGFFTMYCISLDQDCLQIFEKLKVLALTRYNRLDWYKVYVVISSDLDDVSDNSLPSIQINEHEFGKTLSVLQQSSQFKNQYHLSLIKDGVLFSAYGFHEKKGGWKQRSFGETIYADSSKISSIKIYQQVKKNRISSKWNQQTWLRDIDFKQCSQTVNQGLPLWMNTLEIINGTIIISGQPFAANIGQFLIKIFDQNYYILREYKISVIKKEIYTHDNSQILLNKKKYLKPLPKLNSKQLNLPQSSGFIINHTSQNSVNGNILKENQQDQQE